MSTLRVDNVTRRGGAGIPNLGGVAGNRLTPTAWVNFNGFGVAAIRDSHGVASITDNGTGEYAVNFSTPMQNSDYCAVSSGGEPSSRGGANRSVSLGIQTTTYFQLCSWIASSGGGATDLTYVTATVFGGRV